MGFDTYISDGVANIRPDTILGEIFFLHQHTTNPLKYVHKNSKYGHLVAITDSDNYELFSRAEIDKVWVDKILLHLSGGKE